VNWAGRAEGNDRRWRAAHRSRISGTRSGIRTAFGRERLLVNAQQRGIWNEKGELSRVPDEINISCVAVDALPEIGLVNRALADAGRPTAAKFAVMQITGSIQANSEIFNLK
jgi:hypothetical protein